MMKSNTIKRLTICFAISFLTGCVCFQVRPQVAYLASFQFKKCQARCLDFKTLNTLHPKECGQDWATDVVDMPLEMCDDVIGFKIETVAKEIRPQMKESFQCAEDKGCK